MLESRGLKKKYGSLEVLKGVDFKAAPAEIVSIMGDSGAGKTTLLQILGTLDRADSGQVLFDGEDLSQRSARTLAQFRNQNIGFIFQFHHLLPEFTALENVAIPALIARKDKKEAHQRAQELLAFMGLAERAHHKPSALSGGEQQRVAAARALINRPKVVLADEPTGNLDSRNAEEMHALFERIRQEFGTTFVIITHNESLARTADRMLRMKDGQIADFA